MVGGLGGQVGQGPGRLALAGTEIYTPAPTVTSITPPIGSVLGDGPVTIGGTGFGGARSVHVGDVSVACPSAACVIDSVGRMRVSPPPHGAGPVQVAVENALGTSAHLVPEAASRFVFVGPSAISDLVATVTGEHDVHLSFTAAGDGTTTGRATRYVIKESTSPIGDAAAFDAATTLCPTKGCADGIFATFDDALTHDFDIGGLGSGRHYFSVRAENALGQLGPLSNQVSVSLAPCPAIAAPGAGQVGYGGGHYSIVGFPTGTIVHAGSELFGWFDVGAGGTYVTAPLPEAGHGYWAWFVCPTVVVPAPSAADPVVLGLGGFHASMVGNPFATTAAVVSGYDYAAHWDPDMNSGAGGYRISGYQEPQRLAVGEGVWTFSYSPTQVRIEAGS